MTARLQYQPRHAGQTIEAERRSAVRRQQVDLDRALAVLNAQIAADDLTAVRLFLELHPLQMRSALARAS